MRGASPRGSWRCSGPARTPNPANHRQEATRDLINPLATGLGVPRAPYRAAGPGFAVDCCANRGRFAEKAVFEQQNQVREPATTRNRAPQQHRHTWEQWQTSLCSVFVLFRVVRTLSQSCLSCLCGCRGPKLFWKRKKTTKNGPARFPLHKGQVLDSWFRVLTWQRPLSNPVEFSAVV